MISSTRSQTFPPLENSSHPRRSRITTSDHEAIFQYDELDYLDFRLLRLHPLDLNNPLEIKCDLFPASFDYGPYEALSYTWGDLDLVESITVNNGTLRITDNLFAALQHLRHPNHSRLLWIDAVCINQENEHERSVQVQKMRDIYSRAETVIVWLGKATLEVDFLMRSLKGQTLPGRGQVHQTFASLLATSSAEDLQRMKTGLRTLLRRPWFNRIWTVQEVAFARSAFICSGKNSISASTFAVAPVTLDEDVSKHCQSRLDLMLPQATMDPSRADLSSLMYEFRQCDASDERDKIYALLGLSFDPLDEQSIVPDYRAELHEVVGQTMSYLLETKAAPIDRVLDLLPSFKGLTTICVVPLLWDYYDYTETEDLSSREKMLRILLSRNPEGKRPLLLIESQNTSPTELMTGYEEIDRLYVRSQDKPKRTNRISVSPWLGSDQNVTIICIKRLLAALDEFDSFGCHNFVKWLVEFAIDIADDGKYYDRILSVAANDCSIRLLQQMLPKCCNLDHPGDNGRTALHMASAAGREDAVKLLIQHGANVNVQSMSGDTPLCLAASNGQIGMLKMLLDAGADPNAPAGQDGTALQAALRGQSRLFGEQLPNADVEQIVNMLLENGATVNALPTKEVGGVLNYGILRDQDGIVLLLLAAGAHVNPAGDAITPLQMACYHGNTSTVALLIELGAEINAPPRKFGTALHAALHKGHTSIVEMLIKAGADVDPSSIVREAVQTGFEKVVEMLLDFGFDIDSVIDVNLSNREKAKELIKRDENERREELNRQWRLNHPGPHYTLQEIPPEQ